MAAGHDSNPCPRPCMTQLAATLEDPTWAAADSWQAWYVEKVLSRKDLIKDDAPRGLQAVPLWHSFRTSSGIKLSLNNLQVCFGLFGPSCSCLNPSRPQQVIGMEDRPTWPQKRGLEDGIRFLLNGF